MKVSARLAAAGAARMLDVMSERGRLFIADWVDAIFVHFAIEPRKLQPMVPMELDCLDGEAYVSLVSFTQRNLRPCVGGALAAWLATPLASHEFLNVRTYVRHGETRGIFFLAEWIPNRLAALIGPRTYGLPYRLGRMRHDGMDREIRAGGAALRLSCRGDAWSPPAAREPAIDAQRRCLRECAAGAAATQASPLQDEFLLERYTAFTSRRGVVRRFDVDHAPWPQRRVDVDLANTTLLTLSGDWHRHARLVAAHYSPGVRDVAISAPRRVALTGPPAPRFRA